MPIYKKSKSSCWWIDVRTPGGERVRRSTGTYDKRQAQEYHDKVKAELWRLDKLGEQPEFSFDQAALKVLKLSEGQKDYKTKIRHIKYWRSCFGGRAISSLTSDEIFNNLPTHRLVKSGKSKAQPLAAATKNRYLATMSRILHIAYNENWLQKIPKLGKFKEADVRIRWITREQAQLLINQFQTEWMKNVCSFALSTGARMSEILSLEWSQVDIEKKLCWVTGDKAKSGKSRPIPLNSDAMSVIWSCLGKNKKWVFVRDTGTHPKEINRKSFNSAVKKLRLGDFHFHDLRHTWASWHVQSGTPLMVLKELGGWETLEMVKKYAHLDASHLEMHANSVTFWSPFDKTEAA